MSYIEASDATTVRVFDEGTHWAIDASDGIGGYTEACWTWDWHQQVEYATEEHAREFVPEFIAQVVPHLVGQVPA